LVDEKSCAHAGIGKVVPRESHSLRKPRWTHNPVTGIVPVVMTAPYRRPGQEVAYKRQFYCSGERAAQSAWRARDIH